LVGQVSYLPESQKAQRRVHLEITGRLESCPTLGGTMSTTTRARWVLTGESPPIPNGLLECANGHITYVGPDDGRANRVSRQDCAILPGFVNPHTHLEFSSLAQPLGTRGLPFTAWIRQVISWRRERDEDARLSSIARSAAIEAGLAELWSTGTCGVGEISQPNGIIDNDSRPGLAGVRFLEFIGLLPERIPILVDQAQRFLEAALASPCPLRPGLSPHAPYSVHPDLVRQLVELSAIRGVPLAMHLAESREELQLLAHGTGPFSDLLKELKVWSSAVFSHGSRPHDFLQVLTRAHHALVIHGNYLADDEREFLAEHRERMTIVYCPRTHAWFGHPSYPLAELVRTGARVALGTDSRASNPDLNMLSELRFAAAIHPLVSSEELLRMATLHGAEALGIDDELGSLRVGKRAEFVSIPLGASADAGPYSWMRK
jgi:cytosine/adenosine deaminase-related metal-dependent hydrolase